MRKNQTIDDVVIDAFEGSKERNAFFKSLPNDAYKGYVTAMVYRDNSNMDISVSTLYKIVERLFDEGKL